jgi:hypothetical protein
MSLIHWFARGTGTPKDRDEVNRVPVSCHTMEFFFPKCKRDFSREVRRERWKGVMEPRDAKSMTTVESSESQQSTSRVCTQRSSHSYRIC